MGNVSRFMVTQAPRARRLGKECSGREVWDIRERRDPKLEVRVRSPENLERRTSNPCPSRWLRSTILQGHSLLVQDVQDI